MTKQEGRGGRELGNLIPQDDGEGTRCYQITIPDTDDWYIAFFTLIYKFSEGRYWKRTSTGRKITDVQQTGRGILASLIRCDGDDDLTPEQINQIINAINNNCGCDMGCCCKDESNPNDLVDTTEMPIDYPLPLMGDTQGDPSWFEWKCQACDFSITLLADMAAQTASYSVMDVPVVESYADLISRILGGLFPSQPQADAYFQQLWWWHLGFSSLLIESVVQEVSSNISVWILANRVALKNLAFCQESPDAQKIALKEFVNDSAQPPLNRFVLAQWIDAFSWQFMWIAEAERITLPFYPDIVAGSNECTCSGGGGGAPAVPVGWITVPMTVDSFGSVNMGVFSSVQNLWAFEGVPPNGDNAGADVQINQPEYTDLTPVPNIDIGGFIIECDVNISSGGNGFGKQNALPASSFSDLEFFPFLDGETFAGVISTEPDLQAWLTASTFEYKDLNSTINTSDRDIRFLMFGGDNTTAYEAELRCFAIVRVQP